ncbi:hypothetical protein [Halomontanus rarus]|uniref:hypothetical protein n=1 Tax=Halomontanus rarus TaxID=3034020 RepID=UPI0031F2F0E7
MTIYWLNSDLSELISEGLTCHRQPGVDVHDVVPFMLLDSLEAIGSNRIAELVEYFEEYVDYLVLPSCRRMQMR